MSLGSGDTLVKGALVIATTLPALTHVGTCNGKSALAQDSNQENPKDYYFANPYRNNFLLFPCYMSIKRQWAQAAIWEIPIRCSQDQKIPHESGSSVGARLCDPSLGELRTVSDLLCEGLGLTRGEGEWEHRVSKTTLHYKLPFSIQALQIKTKWEYIYWVFQMGLFYRMKEAH